jgi:transcriptional regulator with XRE-family HTH domain
MGYNGGMDAIMSKPASGFGERLKLLRTAKGLTLAEVAERAGLHLQTVAKVEYGTREPNWLTVLALAEALGVTPDAFLVKPKRRPKE